jgi:FAD/FMN-containing dehydrogenase
MPRDATPDFVLRPANIVELAASLARSSAERRTIASFNLATLNRLLEHKPEDMTATAEAGLTLAEMQKQLALRGQWLPIDPPHPESLTVGALLAANASGPRRFGYGTIRDYVIGLKVVLADGRLVSCGGKVVKNVAGYDLARLFIGSRGSLGVIVEATFKLRPLPETERFVQAQCESLDQAEQLLDAVLNSDVAPVVLDLYQSGGTLSPKGPLLDQSARAKSDTRPISLVAGFAGTTQDVDWQLEYAATLGLNQPAMLDYEREFWDDVTSAVQRISVLPSKLIENLHGISLPFIARAGNGIVYHRGAPVQEPDELPVQLCLRLKQAWDPQNVLPALPL